MKRNAFCFDLDGTLCDVSHRRQYVATKPKNWNAWNSALGFDTPHLAVKKVFQALRNSHDYDTGLIIVSGRSEDYKVQTDKWLRDHEIFYDEIYMRKSNDNRDDAIVKGEFADQIQEKYNIIAVFDDRKKVIENTWLSRGIFVFDVGQGKSNF
jgi:uncharacterized HAD superfamily protein